MEKVLKYERQLMWSGIGLICLAMALFLLSLYLDSRFFMGMVSGLAFGFAIAHAMSRRVIKELKREIETLKSGASTGSVEPTSPEYES